VQLTREELGETLAVVLSTCMRNRREIDDPATDADHANALKYQQRILLSVMNKINDDLKRLTPSPAKGTTV
jgi:hypothetical protein